MKDKYCDSDLTNKFFRSPIFYCLAKKLSIKLFKTLYFSTCKHFNLRCVWLLTAPDPNYKKNLKRALSNEYRILFRYFVAEAIVGPTSDTRQNRAILSRNKVVWRFWHGPWPVSDVHRSRRLSTAVTCARLSAALRILLLLSEVNSKVKSQAASL